MINNTTEVTCPSGLVGQVRGLKTKELDLLNNPKAQKGSNVTNVMLSDCWVETSDPGPYTLDASGKLDWNKVLSGDRYYILLKIREATYGEEYSFKYQCSDVVCRHKYEWELNFNDLQVKKLSDEGLEAFKAGNKAEVEVDGTKVFYRLQTGEGEERASKLMKRSNSKISSALASRLVSIDGVDSGKILEFIEDLPLAVTRKLVKALDKNDCGVESTIEVVCPRCGNTEEIDLPLGREFWYPS